MTKATIPELHVPELHQRIRNRMPDASPVQARRWADIRNAAGDDDEPAVVRIYDVIDAWGAPFGVSADEVAQDLAAITASEIRVEINSPGGDVFDGIAIYNALRAHPARVTTRVDGIAASAASIIVQAGDQRQVMSSAQLMIHEAWGICIGPAPDHRELADLLDKENDVIAGLYAARSGRDTDEFRELMRTDTYLTDQQSLDLGLVDEIVEPPRRDTTSNQVPAPSPVAAAIEVPVVWDPNTATYSVTIAEEVAASADLQTLGGALSIALRSASTATTSTQPGGTPSAGEREEPAPDEREPSGVSREDADGVLASLTLTKENP